MSRPISKTAKVYSTNYSLPSGAVMEPGEFDWNTNLGKFRASVLPEERRFDGIYYEPLQVAEGDSWLLTMHRPINSDFMSLIGPDGTVRDTTDTDTPIGELAYSSCVLFTEDARCAALLKGNRSAPGRSDLEAFLRRWFPPGETDARWNVRAVVLPDQLPILREARGALGVEMSFERADDLLSDMDHEGDSPLSAISTRLRDDLGSDLQLTLNLDLNKPSQSSLQKLRDAVVQEFQRATRRPKRARVAVISKEGQQRVLDLIAEELTVEIEITTVNPDNISFRELALSLETAREEINRATRS